MANGKDKGGTQTCRTNPLPHTITPVPRYPKKLVVYMSNSSPFWWVRYYANGKILRRSTRTTNKREAFESAKKFYDEINFKQSTGQALTLNTLSNFGVCASEMLKSQESKLKRKEISQISHDNDVLRMNKHVKPYFGHMDIKSINYKTVEGFLAMLDKENLAAATLTYYLGLVKKVLSYAQRIEVLQNIPQLPRIKKRDSPRGWFTLTEYRRLHTSARHLAGKVFFVKQVETLGDDGERKKETYTIKEGEKDTRMGKPIRKITISRDLRNVISFMTNSFIRPTDLKHMQHKHVVVLDENEKKALVLNLPKSKEHDQPIWTMPNAVEIYLRQCKETKPSGEDWEKLTKKKKEEAWANQYVFLPETANRDKALKSLQVQFAIVCNESGLKKGSLGQERTMYSLRHTCIMYRLMYGFGIDLLTLANNARTSPEMIHRFYARHLTGGQNLEMLQSKRSRKLRVPFFSKQLEKVLLSLAEGSSKQKREDAYETPDGTRA